MSLGREFDVHQPDEIDGNFKMFTFVSTVFPQSIRDLHNLILMIEQELTVNLNMLMYLMKQNNEKPFCVNENGFIMVMKLLHIEIAPLH